MNAFFQGHKPVLGFMLFCVLWMVGGCEKAPLKPAAIGPNDICFYCRAPIIAGGEKSQEAFAAEFITKDGFLRKFDDIGCLIANAQKVGKKNIVAYYAVDLVSKAWLPAEQLTFVRSDKIRTPRNGGIIAFQDAARAQQVAAQYQAELVKLSDFIK